MKRFIVLLVVVLFAFVATGSFAAEGKPEAQKDAVGVVGNPPVGQKDASSVAGEQKSQANKKVSKKRKTSKKKKTTKKKKTSKKQSAKTPKVKSSTNGSAVQE